jgi:hypothetical protein
MTSRRDFLRAGLTAAFLLGVKPGAWSKPHIPGPEPFCKLIFDERFPASAARARQLAGAGTPLHGITGDVTSLWYRDLYFAWQKRPVPIAGVTTRESLFCLEMLARDSGLSVIERHDIDNELVLWSIGPRPPARHR